MAGRILLGKYELRREIGVGGSGVVYLAWDRHLERYVAVKAEKQPEEPARPDILKKEMEILKALKHPMLPVVYDYFQEIERYLVMEYIHGESLHNLIEREGSISEKQVYKWAIQLSDLLSYLHMQKPPVIYCDLKPENMIVCPDGNLRVIDFGAALRICYDGNAQERLAGTIGYASPEQQAGTNGHAPSEQLAGTNGYTPLEQLTGMAGNQGGYEARADERSDIYTLGTTMYHMLTGHSPARPPYGLRPIRCMKPELTRDMERIVEKCTEEEPSKRYQTMLEVKKDLAEQRFSGRRHFFREFRRRKRYVLRRMEKQVWLTEKATTGLLAAGVLLCGLFTGLFSIQVKGQDVPLPVIVYNKQGQKVVIRYDSIYSLDGNLVFELERELFKEAGVQELSIGLTDCESGERRERIFYIKGSEGEKGK
ncbi:MAG: serine/threonine protein kinase [Lachnospiraceae bacterium]|nr:serine/threonine protein kinase [Lachnospiraceae bacterium]